jgi:hypothetical protein
MVEHAHDHDKLGVDIQAKLDGLNIAGGLLQLWSYERFSLTSCWWVYRLGVRPPTQLMSSPKPGVNSNALSNFAQRLGVRAACRRFPLAPRQH